MIYDRVRELTTSTSTGTISLSPSGAPAGYRSFTAAVPNGSKVVVLIAEAAGAWEAGLHTFVAGSPATITRSAADVINGSSGPGNLVNFGAGTKTVDVVLLSELVGPMGGRLSYAVATGSANAFVVTLSPAPRALVDGMLGGFKANFDITGACTVDYGGLGQKPLRKGNGTVALVANDIVSGQDVPFRFDAGLQVLKAIGIPVLGAGLINLTSGIVPTRTPLAKSAAYTVVFADRERIIDCTGAFTLSFPSAATLGAGWSCGFKNSGSGNITHDPAGSETINGQSTLVCGPGQEFDIYSDGANLFTKGRITVMVGDTGSGGAKGLVPAPAAGDALKALFGDGTFKLPGEKLARITVFTGSGTFTKGAAVKSVVVELWGGGGGGGGTGISLGGGGGSGGGYSAKVIVASALGTTETVTVGAAGIGGDDTNGGAGGTTSFGVHLSATGGGAGITNGTSNLPGSGSGGNINLTGGRGGVGGSGSGAGGGAPRGGLGGSASSAPPTAGNAGQVPGGGGSGGLADGASSTPAGASGGAGMVIVWEYE